MEIVGLLALALLIGLFIRNKGDNTMDTMSKGCGCIVIATLLILWIVFFLLMYQSGMFDFLFTATE